MEKLNLEFGEQFRSNVAEAAAELSLVDKTTERQKKRGTIQLYDEQADCYYTLHKNGYIRRKYYRNDRRFFYGHVATYQLNRQVTRKGEYTDYNGQPRSYTYTDRVGADEATQISILKSVVPKYRVHYDNLEEPAPWYQNM